MEKINNTVENHFLKELNNIFKKYPDRVALKLGDQEITYEELNIKTGSIAKYVNERIKGENGKVGIVMERSIESILSVIGVLRSRCCYIPIDPGNPKNRVKHIISQSKPDFILTNFVQKDNSLFNEFPQEKIALFEELEMVEESYSYNSINSLDSNAYIIYTSGSTGLPKGVIMSHKAMNNIIQWQIKESYKNLGSSNITLQFASTSFDVSLQEIFSTLTVGGKLILISENERVNFEEISRIIVAEGINRIFIPPVFLNELVKIHVLEEYDFKTLKEIIVAGEQLKITSEIKEFFTKNEQCKLINQYGPTEAHVVTHYQMDSDVSTWKSLPPIGNPIDNVNLYILDKDLMEVKNGEWGELYIGGDCISKGYIGNENETKNRFINHPDLGKVIYKSGDIVRVNDALTIEYKGREDNQVKVRGYRIELSEIENLLFENDNVKDCKIVVTEGKYGDNKILAFIINNYKIRNYYEEEQIKQSYYNYLKDYLPEYMLPRKFILLENFPMTPNGKVDKKKLIKLSKNIKSNGRSNSNIKGLKKDLIEIWMDVLDIDEYINTNVNFFDLGGNSILVTKLLAKVNKELNIKIPIVDFYDNPTIEKLVYYIRGINLKKSNKRFTKKTDNSNQNNDIAIIGLSCRFPGSKNTSEFWNNIITGKDSINRSISNQTEEKTTKIFAGGMLEDVEYFDAKFFGISDKDAKIMDPQHRHFLECSWEAFEDAGYNPYKINDRVGVFAGAGVNSYLFNNVLTNRDDTTNFLNSMEDLRVHYNSDKDYISTRLSYIFDLKGPSINVQTACSTSLVSVHLACQSINNNECEMAIAGASTIMIPQGTGYQYDENMVFSHDGVVRAFDKDSTGIVYGDGVGVVLLKSLEQAKEDNDYIYGVIKGSAVNNDGGSKAGFTAPNIDGQERVIREALENANIAPETIDYVEAHGTGTKVGDEIEIKALTQAFDVNKSNYCAIGSVKNNIGHTAWSSGIAGLIKVVLALKNKRIPPMININNINPNLNLKNTPFYVSNNVKYWDKKTHSRRAGVSSFGLGGTNAHVIIEEFINPSSKKANPERSSHLLTISGMDKDSVKNILQKYEENIDEILNHTSVEDLCFTANVGRKHFNNRLTITFENKDKLKEKLRKINSAKEINRYLQSTGNEVAGQTGFLFTGNGSQYENMGKELYDTNVDFRESMDYCEDVFYKITGKSILESLYNEKEKDKLLNDLIYSQVAIFSVEYSLATMWGKMGISPDVLVGHSLGEYVAACVAGVFSVKDSIRLLVKRGELLNRVGSDLGMVSVRASDNLVENLLTSNNVNLSIASYNTPEQVVLSGENSEINKFLKICKKQGIEFEKMIIPVAGHTKLLEIYLPEFREALSGVKFNSPSCQIISSITGNIIEDEVKKPDYWCEHLIKPVQFKKAIDTLTEMNFEALIEIGPNPVLLGLVMECNPHYKTMFLPTLRKDVGDWQQLFYSIEKLYLKGYPIEFNTVYPRGRKVKIPTYAFKRNRHWIDSQTTRSLSNIDLEESDWKKYLYNNVWEEKQLSTQGEEFANDEWLIFCDNKEQMNTIIESDYLKGISYTIILKAETNKILNEKVFSVKSEHFYPYLSQKLKKRSFKVMYLWDNQKNEIILPNTQLDLKKASTLCYEFVNFIKQITKMDKELREIWIVNFSEESKNPNDLSINLENYMIQAISRVVELEDPNLNIKRVYFDKDSHPVIRDNLNKELRWNSTDDDVSYTKGIRKVLNLKEHSVNETKPSFSVSNQGVYIITGGNGGIGEVLTNWLIEEGAKHLIILNRSSPSKEILKKVNKFEKENVRIEIKQVDVTDFAMLEKVFLEIVKEGIELKGIFHLSGIVEDSTINQLDFKKVEKVLSPKVKGSWNLHILSKKFFEKLELFVMFSSTASVIGNAGQANHAAANAFMDALVFLRKNEGMEATSINWGAWEQVGHLGNSNTTLARLKRKGFKSITPAQGLRILQYVINQNINRIAVIPMNWKKFISEHNLQGKSLYQDICKRYLIAQERKELSILQRLSILDKENRISYLENYMKSLFDSVLGIKVENKEFNKALLEFNVDSLSSIELRNKIQTDLNLELSLNSIFKNKSINILISQINELLNQNISTEGKVSEEPLSSKESYYELSSQQERWLKLIKKQYGERVCPIIYNVEFKQEVFMKAIKVMLTRHESLRWYFPNQTVKEMTIDKILHLNKEIVNDLSVFNQDLKVKKINETILELFDKMPSPTERPSWMIKCLKLSPKRFVILLSVQHLDFDGTSISVFAKEFKAIYEHYLFGKPLSLDVPVQYKEYIKWQNNYKQKHISIDRAFFKGLFGTLGKTTVLPSKTPHVLGEPLIASKFCPEIVDGLYNKVNIIANKKKVSAFSVLLAAYSLLISEIVGSKEVIIATIVNGRTDNRFRNTIGPFTAPFPFRIWTSSSVEELIEQCNSLIIEINSRAHYPVTDLVNTTQVFENMPLETYFSDVGINFTNYKKQDELEENNYKILEVLGSIEDEEFKIFNNIEFKRVPGLHLVINQVENDLTFNYFYHKERFSESTVKIWSDRFHDILEGFCKIILDDECTSKPVKL